MSRLAQYLDAESRKETYTVSGLHRWIVRILNLEAQARCAAEEEDRASTRCDVQAGIGFDTMEQNHGPEPS